MMRLNALLVKINGEKMKLVVWSLEQNMTGCAVVGKESRWTEICIKEHPFKFMFNNVIHFILPL